MTYPSDMSSERFIRSCDIGDYVTLILAYDVEEGSTPHMKHGYVISVNDDLIFISPQKRPTSQWNINTWGRKEITDVI